MAMIFVSHTQRIISSYKYFFTRICPAKVVEHLSKKETANPFSFCENGLRKNSKQLISFWNNHIVMQMMLFWACSSIQIIDQHHGNCSQSSSTAKIFTITHGAMDNFDHIENTPSGKDSSYDTILDVSKHH